MGALGQIGSELTSYLQEHYGVNRVIASDLRKPPSNYPAKEQFVQHDCTHPATIENLIREHDINVIYNLPALLSVNAEIPCQSI